MLAGIDINVNRILQRFNENLWPDVDRKVFYGIAYRNEQDRGKRIGSVIPEVFQEGTNDYKEVIFDDRLNALCFFDVSNEINNITLGEYQRRDVRIIFCVNLKALYPGEVRRLEENAHYDVLNILYKYESNSINFNSITSGIGAYGDLYSGNLKKYNMHPYHVFSVNCEFIVNCTCNN